MNADYYFYYYKRTVNSNSATVPSVWLSESLDISAPYFLPLLVHGHLAYPRVEVYDF